MTQVWCRAQPSFSQATLEMNFSGLETLESLKSKTKQQLQTRSVLHGDLGSLGNKRDDLGLPGQCEFLKPQQ